MCVSVCAKVDFAKLSTTSYSENPLKHAQLFPFHRHKVIFVMAVGFHPCIPNTAKVRDVWLVVGPDKLGFGAKISQHSI